jgi:hypothetical protein
MTVKILEKPKIECREMEPNPSKDRVMHEGNNPSFKLNLYNLSFS